MKSINRNVMLLQQFLPATRQISSEFFICQYNAQAHRTFPPHRKNQR